MSEVRGRHPIILASGSKTRASMLKAAGLSFEIVPAAVDEPSLFRAAQTENPEVDPLSVALLLARAKAAEVSSRYPGALVIGGDQVLALGKEMIFKAVDRDEARSILQKLRGQPHELYSAAALAQKGSVVWTAVESARLTMRVFSDAFLNNYLEEAGGALTSSAGAYQIEGAGVGLFQSVDGNHFTILGLPLLPLLAELRSRHILPE